jgi:DNA polymerase III delta prime subunit
MQAIRFPTCNHVISESNSKASPRGLKMSEASCFHHHNKQEHCWWNQMSDIRQHVARTFPSNLQQQQPSSSPTSIGNQNINDNTMIDRKNGSFDLLSLAIQRYIVPSPTTMKHDKRLSNCTDGTLWVDRYYNSATINPSSSIVDDAKVNEYIANDYSTSQRNAYQQIHSFIERFMFERHKVEQTIIEKRNKRRRKFYDVSSPPTNGKLKNAFPKLRHNVKRSTCEKYSDDDCLWVDDDDASDSGTCTSSLCVLSGPIGCGKSNLVHHVAKQLGCRKVVELHTGMKRNSASIKRYIEEATKSHSTFDMLHNQQQQKSHTFAKPANCNEGNNSKNENGDTSTNERGSAVTVILIDEVDNLDPCTDTGFWPALCDLYKQSKCPIIVTCNTIPRELCSGSSFQFTHVPMKSPTPTECSEQLQNILSNEGFVVHPDYISDTCYAINPLVTIAEIGNCDMRRILHELQLFHVRTLSALSLPVQLLQPSDSKNCTTVIDTKFQLPKIESTYPNVIYLDRYTSMTITGSSFLSLIDPTNQDCKDTIYGYNCDVYIGDVCCRHGRIINDTTVIAIIAPLHSTIEVDQRQTKYLPVNICCSKQLGLLSTTRNSITSIDLPDQTKMYGASGPCLVECRLLDPVSKPNNDFENDLDNTATASAMTSVGNEDYTAHIGSLLRNEVDSNVASQLLRTSVDDWIMKYGNVQKVEATDEACEVRSNDLQLLDDMWVQASRSSDASLFEDIGLNFVPMISGACRGFGFTYTDDYPKRTNENSKPYVT